jgi:hypothetical protein
MNLPQFNAEASLGPTLGIYRGKAVYGGSGAVEVLPMLPRRPTIDTSGRCFRGDGESGCEGLLCWCCYSDGCWICNNDAGQPGDCVWDEQYRTQSSPPTPLGGVFVETGMTPRVPPTGGIPFSERRMH